MPWTEPGFRRSAPHIADTAEFADWKQELRKRLPKSEMRREIMRHAKSLWDAKRAPVQVLSILEAMYPFPECPGYTSAAWQAYTEYATKKHVVNVLRACGWRCVHIRSGSNSEYAPMTADQIVSSAGKPHSRKKSHQVHTNIDSDTYSRARKFAAAYKISMGILVESALVEYMNNIENGAEGAEIEG